MKTMTATAEGGAAMEVTMTETAATSPTPGTVRVWDPLVRVFHWGLVGAFGVAWLTAEELQTVHEIAGYTVAGLVAFRGWVPPAQIARCR